MNMCKAVIKVINPDLDQRILCTPASGRCARRNKSTVQRTSTFLTLITINLTRPEEASGNNANY